MSLAIVEKRHGGCAAIFFHLFDWNRKLPKKKLFSKKLFPPVRTVKRSMKKFGVDEKIPRTKLMLIDNENRGGFPSSKKMDSDESVENVVRSPGLVARLMGLEFLPVIDDEKPRKGLDSDCFHEGDKFGEYSRVDQDLCDEILGQGKLDCSRPVKLQKIGGFLEGRTENVGRFSPDVIRRNFVVRSVKQHRKPVSLVKSPRLLSRGNQARLMQAATKILEPGLQHRRSSRSKSAIACNGVSESESLGFESDVMLKKSNEPQNDLRCAETDSLASNNVPACSHFSNLLSLRCSDDDNKVHNGDTLLASQAKFVVHGKVRDSMERKQDIASDQAKSKYAQKINPKLAPKNKSLSRYELPMRRENSVHGSRLCSRRQIDSDSNEFMVSKHFEGVRKNLNSSLRSKSDSKASSSNGISTRRNVWEKNVVRKRRMSSNLQTDNATKPNLSFMKQRNFQSEVTKRKGVGLIYSQGISRNRAKNEPQKRINVESISNGNNGVVSFTITSPMKDNSLSFAKGANSGQSGDQLEPSDDTFHTKKLGLNLEKDILPSSRGNCSLRRDDLSNLLEEKIRELNSLEQVDMGIRDVSERSTASILEELISALISEESAVPSIYNDEKSEVSTPKNNFLDSFAMQSDKAANKNQNFDINPKFQEVANPYNASSVVSDSNHPSPISIFDASFSSESCSVGSFNGSFDMKDYKTTIDLTHKCDKTESLSLDSDLLDSANSVEISTSNNEMILNCGEINSSMHCVQSYDGGILRTKTGYSIEAISKTKLLLESIIFVDSDTTMRSSVNFFLFDIFDSISDSFFARMKSNLTLSDVANDYNHIKDFLFDFLIEILVSRFNQFCMSGYKIWLKLPHLLTKNQLLKEIYGELGRLLELAGKFLDDLAEQELSSSIIRWTSFGDEASWTAMDVESSILQEVIDEMVVDLLVISKLDEDFNKSGFN